MTIDRNPIPWGHMVRNANIEHDSLIYVNRDPCPKCGVRRDLGCKHTMRK